MLPCRLFLRQIKLFVLYLRKNNYFFRISHVDVLKTARNIVYSDASLANNSNNSTQGGFLIGLSPNDKIFVPLAWQSLKLRRIVHSTLSAEALGLLDALDCAILLRDQFLEMSFFSLSVHCYIDTKSLWDSINSLKNVTEKCFQVDLSYLWEIVAKESVDVKHVNSASRWMHQSQKISSRSLVEKTELLPHWLENEGEIVRLIIYSFHNVFVSAHLRCYILHVYNIFISDACCFSHELLFAIAHILNTRRFVVWLINITSRASQLSVVNMFQLIMVFVRIAM